ncbi:predicted protein [Sclerotinia sclerotiorum 1980 UF-70]|uniref:Uncharacterized protein n=1 Tax=Sclerotinia sclerotiorum (strain ATCC 18683 / 1980 / Ss-1) TaxID=665079 RepID=A7F7W4_SCLS1|nr:predicted protein [Sclerotinia sclerotiorum 1980 UF-70]EDN98835.1 predicted protein [Sclerotinia sclerotiorum 1980 UF-70]
MPFPNCLSHNLGDTEVCFNPIPSEWPQTFIAQRNDYGEAKEPNYSQFVARSCKTHYFSPSRSHLNLTMVQMLAFSC